MRAKIHMFMLPFQPVSGDRDACVLVNHLTVCFPDLLSHRPLSQLRGSIGHLMIFKHESNQTTRAQKQQDFQLQWIVIVPGTRKNIPHQEPVTRSEQLSY